MIPFPIIMCNIKNILYYYFNKFNNNLQRCYNVYVWSVMPRKTSLYAKFEDLLIFIFVFVIKLHKILFYTLSKMHLNGVVETHLFRKSNVNLYATIDYFYSHLPKYFIYKTLLWKETLRFLVNIWKTAKKT